MSQLQEAELGRNEPSNIRMWVAEQRVRSHIECVQVPVESLRGWSIDSGARIRHESGKFFSVHAARLQVDTEEWTQPLAVQDETGVLGFAIARNAEGVYEFLLQARAEPGVVGDVVLGPTLQATYSNLTQVHGGAAQPYAEHFEGRASSRVLVDVVQGEHGCRFLRKRNRNVVIEWETPTPPTNSHFRWFTVRELMDALTWCNVVNAEARSVLACLASWHPSVVGLPEPWAVAEGTLPAAAQAPSTVELRPLTPAMWRGRGETDGAPTANVIGVRVVADREVQGWDQPLLAEQGSGVAALVLRSDGDDLLALIRHRVEPASLHTRCIGPTLQAGPQNPRRQEYVDRLAESDLSIVYDVIHGEDGGRFYRAQIRYVLALVEDEDVGIPDSAWISLPLLLETVRAGLANHQLRSLVGLLPAALGGLSTGD